MNVERLITGVHYLTTINFKKIPSKADLQKKVDDVVQELELFVYDCNLVEDFLINPVAPRTVRQWRELTQFIQKGEKDEKRLQILIKCTKVWRGMKNRDISQRVIFCDVEKLLPLWKQTVECNELHDTFTMRLRNVQGSLKSLRECVATWDRRAIEMEFKKAGWAGPLLAWESAIAAEEYEYRTAFLFHFLKKDTNIPRLHDLLSQYYPGERKCMEVLLQFIGLLFCWNKLNMVDVYSRLQKIGYTRECYNVSNFIPPQLLCGINDTLFYTSYNGCAKEIWRDDPCNPQYFSSYRRKFDLTTGEWEDAKYIGITREWRLEQYQRDICSIPIQSINTLFRLYETKTQRQLICEELLRKAVKDGFLPQGCLDGSWEEEVRLLAHYLTISDLELPVSEDIFVYDDSVKTFAGAFEAMLAPVYEKLLGTSFPQLTLAAKEKVIGDYVRMIISCDNPHHLNPEMFVSILKNGSIMCRNRHGDLSESILLDDEERILRSDFLRKIQFEMEYLPQYYEMKDL